MNGVTERDTGRASIHGVNLYSHGWPRVYHTQRSSIREAPYKFHTYVMTVGGAVIIRLFSHESKGLLYPQLDGSLRNDVDAFNPQSNVYPAKATAPFFETQVRGWNGWRTYCYGCCNSQHDRWRRAMCCSSQPASPMGGDRHKVCHGLLHMSWRISPLCV